MKVSKLKVAFNTLTGRIELTMGADEVRNTDLEPYFERLIAMRADGVVGATYEIPAYGKVEFTLVETEEKTTTLTEEEKNELLKP